MEITDSVSNDDDILDTVVFFELHRRCRRRTKNVYSNVLSSQEGISTENYNVLQEMRLADTEIHFVYLRMSKQTFYTLLHKE